MKELNKKIITLILVITFVFSPIFAIPAQAQWIDISTMAKDYGLDALAFQLVNMIIKRISASTVNWINSGFKGSPAYVTNPEAYFTDMGDKIAGQYIFNNPNLNFLCGPISAKIRLALAANYTQYQNVDRWRCTLTQVGRNMDNFMSDFDNGGWDSFFEISQRQQNNPIGAYIMAENELLAQIAAQQETAQTELNQGGGFLSYKKCKAGTESTAGGTKQCSDSFNACMVATGEFDPTRSSLCTEALNNCEKNIGSIQPGDCKDSDKETVTPGSVISDKLNSVLGQSEGRLVMADEINEMISALISQLTEQLVGGAIGGLRGLSNPSSTGDNSFANQMITDTSNKDYFNNTPDTSVLDQPVQGQAADADCNSVDPATLDLMAQRIVNNSGIPFDQARNNLDCDPPGIH